MFDPEATISAVQLDLLLDTARRRRPADTLPPLPERTVPLAVVAVGVPLAADRIPGGHPATRLPAHSRRALDELLIPVV